MTFDARATYTNERSYVLKLHRDTRPSVGRIIGQLEHIPSGRRYTFNSADELVACLATAVAECSLDSHPDQPASRSES